MVAEVKTLKFYEGLSVLPPDQTLPVNVGIGVNPTHAVVMGQVNDLIQAKALKVVGSDVAPISIISVDGIPFSGIALDNLIFAKSNGGAITVSANPQIAAGSFVGQKLRIVFKHAVDTVTLTSSNGVLLIDDADYTSDLDRTLYFNYNGTAWAEEKR